MNNCMPTNQISRRSGRTTDGTQLMMIQLRIFQLCNGVKVENLNRPITYRISKKTNKLSTKKSPGQTASLVSSNKYLNKN